MSNNEGEVRALIAAVEAAKLTREPEKIRLCLYGDSQVALKWARKAGKRVIYRPKPGWSQGFAAAVANLYSSLQPFAEVVTEWQPRATSMQMLGH